MRKFYFSIAISLIVILAIFVSSFFYLDKESRRAYQYAIYRDGVYTGTISASRFATEGKYIYKETETAPLASTYTQTKSKIVLDRKYRLESYTRERSIGTTSETVYLEANGTSASFLSKFQHDFTTLSGMPISSSTFIFDAADPLTYFPILENYDFSKGRSQGFNTLTFFSASLPPIKRFITLTSIKDEYLKVESRKIKTENLILKIRNYPQGSIWVAKSNRSLVMLEIPEKRLKIIRTFAPKTITPQETPPSDSYLSRNLTFKNGKTELNGTLTTPKGNGPFPAVLLVPGAGPVNRDDEGLFSTIADTLSRQGFCVFRYDKRGVGTSGGEAIFSSDESDRQDAAAALECLSSDPAILKDRIALIGHMRGATYAAALAQTHPQIRALICLAPFTHADYGALYMDPEDLDETARKSGWDGTYLNLVKRMVAETREKVQTAKYTLVFVLRKLCLIKNTKDRLTEDPVSVIDKITVPVLTIQGRQDLFSSMTSTARLDASLEKNGNKHHTLTYYSYLDHHFGKKVSDGMHREYYAPDTEVLNNIARWLSYIFREEAAVDDKGNGVVQYSPEGAADAH